MLLAFIIEDPTMYVFPLIKNKQNLPVKAFQQYID